MSTGPRGNTLIIFVRQSALGRVKRRLACDIGASAARRVYDALTCRALARLGRDRRWRTVLAVTPAGARWRAWGDVARGPQGPGALGRRIGRARPRHGRGDCEGGHWVVSSWNGITAPACA